MVTELWAVAPAAIASGNQPPVRLHAEKDGRHNHRGDACGHDTAHATPSLQDLPLPAITALPFGNTGSEMASTGLGGKEAGRVREQAYGTPQGNSLGSEYVCPSFDVGF